MLVVGITFNYHLKSIILKHYSSTKFELDKIAVNSVEIGTDSLQRCELLTSQQVNRKARQAQ